ncbi:hypothetical protein GS429_21535 [Natronorubrum sp. JWXQ-INN-674]|uniref:Uncharacterized protein n=1 Tax=Natronorubrum halalkaliphilum TaxID=2691917 RepID=A0A6B0VVL4_9EURY|nr:hypothetical protein [Natronorubrum halalkaliphilum]MXV64609.1 hypothetical protein [Natronorubrum halalkaliphilum]
MNRRQYVAILGTASTTALAGCVSELGLGGDDDDDNGGDDEADTTDESAEDADHEAVLVTEAYMEAAAEEDLEGVSEAMHTYHPFDPAEMAADAEEDDDAEFTFGGGDVVDYEVELADEGYETDDIHEIPYIEFWFEDVDLENVLEGEEAALVDVYSETREDGRTTTTEETLVALTEDGEWRVFVTYESEESHELPEGDPVDDETYRVVDDLEFDADDEMVRVNFVDSIDSSIEEIIAYSESHGRGSSVYEPEDSNDDYAIPATWINSPFDPDGDEIVVTVVVDGEEMVVHRETYEP